MKLVALAASSLLALSSIASAAEPKTSPPPAAAAKGADAKAGEATAVIPVKGMHCGGCVGHVNDAVKKLSGVKSVNTDLDKAQTTVVFDAAAVKPEQIVSAIAETGYEPGKPVVK